MNNARIGRHWITGSTIVLLLVPMLANAAGAYFISLFTQTYFLINRAIPVVIGLAVLFFMWGLARYILQTDSVEGKRAARDIMVWGVITIFIMTAVWGFVYLLQAVTGTGGFWTIPPAWPQL